MVREGVVLLMLRLLHSTSADWHQETDDETDAHSRVLVEYMRCTFKLQLLLVTPGCRDDACKSKAFAQVQFT